MKRTHYKQERPICCPRCGFTFNNKENPFVPPTSKDVEEEAKRRGYVMDGSAFVEYHQSAGWKVGKKPMVDWKRAVGTWIRNSRKWNDGQVRTAPTQNSVKINVGFQRS